MLNIHCFLECSWSADIKNHYLVISMCGMSMDDRWFFQNGGPGLRRCRTQSIIISSVAQVLQVPFARMPHRTTNTHSTICALCFSCSCAALFSLHRAKTNDIELSLFIFMRGSRDVSNNGCKLSKARSRDNNIFRGKDPLVFILSNT